MAFLKGFGLAVPERVVTNDELAPQLAVEPQWIFSQSGIRERRYAAADDTVASLGLRAALDCLETTGLRARELGLILVSSGSPDRFCPGPASAIAASLGLTATPSLDLPIASAGSLAGLALASHLAEKLGNILVIGAEIMSRRVDLTPAGRNTAILFGDGAGAALVSPTNGFARIAASCLHTDGNAAGLLGFTADRIVMDGPAIIRHVTRKIPQAIEEVLAATGVRIDQIGTFLLHQANLNLFSRIASTLKAEPARFFANIECFGNTSSASMLIAAAEWRKVNPGPLTAPIVFSAFGVGLNWGALLATPE